MRVGRSVVKEEDGLHFVRRNVEDVLLVAPHLRNEMVKKPILEDCCLEPGFTRVIIYHRQLVHLIFEASWFAALPTTTGLRRCVPDALAPSKAENLSLEIFFRGTLSSSLNAWVFTGNDLQYNAVSSAL